MLHDFSQYIRDIGIFTIFAAIILLVAPADKYKGYIRLALGFIMIALVLFPVLTTLSGGNADEILRRFSDEAFLGMSAESANYDAERADMIIDEYKKGVNTQIKALVERNGQFSYISSETDVSSLEDDFGAIKRLDVTVSDSPSGVSGFSTPMPFIGIEPVEVGRIGAFSYTHSDDIEDPDISALKKLFADFYNLSELNINITVQRKKG